jgi:hypothetical protein
MRSLVVVEPSASMVVRLDADAELIGRRLGDRDWRHDVENLPPAPLTR